MEALDSAGVEVRDSLFCFCQKPLSVWMLLKPSHASSRFLNYSQAAMEALACVEMRDSVVILEEATLSVNAPKT